jgi:prokaryotic ubiquitin-like protein Pup
MPERARKTRPHKEASETEAQEQPTSDAKAQEIDDLLDEIDEVLEDNAEEFVRSYVQKGGE